MIESITAARVANAIRQERSQYAGAFLIVEGQTDARVYDRHVKTASCRVVVAHNKENAVTALEILDHDSFVGVLAIVDADFDRLDGKTVQSKNLYLTDTHDLETMMLQSRAMEKLLREFGSTQKQEKFTEKRGKGIRAVLLEEGSHVGYLRWISLRHSHALKFEGLNYRDFVDHPTLVVNLADLIQTVKNHSQKLHIPTEQLQQQIEAIKDEAHDLWQVCCGHDLIGLLSVGLHQAVGSRDWKKIEMEILEGNLRLAYEDIWFQATQLFASIRQWEAINSPFEVFSE